MRIFCVHIYYKAPQEAPILEDSFTEGRLEALSHIEMSGKKKRERINKQKVARTREWLLKNPQSGSKKAKLNVRIC